MMWSHVIIASDLLVFTVRPQCSKIMEGYSKNSMENRIRRMNLLWCKKILRGWHSGAVG